jgi:hypothetical protein
LSDADSNKAYVDARLSLKETAKWVVTIVGSTIVLVIGGGLIAKIADLDLLPRLAAAGSLFFLTIVCLIPLRAAIDIVATKLVTFEDIATSDEYAKTRAIVNRWMRDYYKAPIGTVEDLFHEYVTQARIANDSNAGQPEQDRAQKAIGELQPSVRKIIELSNTEFLGLKFNWMVRTTTFVVPLIGAVLFAFLIATHRDDQTEKQLAKPILLQVAWSADVEAAMKKAGLDEKCYVPERPRLLQLSEKSGLRAGVLVIPRDLGLACPAVRVIVTDTDQVYPDN